MTEKKEIARETWNIYDTITDAIPEGANMLAVIRAAEFVIADCIAQSSVDKDTKEKTFAAIAEDIRNFTKTFEERVYVNKLMS